MTPDIHTVRDALKKDYKTLDSWRLVAEKWGLSKGMAFRIAERNYEPKLPAIRLRLGLPLPSVHVVPVAGPVPEGTLVIGAQRCECGQWFISNHPRRIRCFLCSPFKGKRRTSE